MTREEVLTLLPEIMLIHSTDLQDKRITCWHQVLELGGWDKQGVDKDPLAAGTVADNCPETGIDHCRRVVRMCPVSYTHLDVYKRQAFTVDTGKWSLSVMRKTATSILRTSKFPFLSLIHI